MDKQKLEEARQLAMSMTSHPVAFGTIEHTERAGVADLQREVARLKVENARLAEETMRLQGLLNAAHQIVGELARPSGI